MTDALNLALHEAMNTPMEDRFVIIHEHKAENFFISETFPNMKRSNKRMIIEVAFSNLRTLDQKRKLVELITKYAMEKAGVAEDDICVMMSETALENIRSCLHRKIW